MGQKTHPIGLRVGIHRKWTSSWYLPSQTKGENTPFYSQFIAKGFISSRGGFFVEGFQDFVDNILRRYSVTKLVSSRQYCPVDFRCFKGSRGHRYCFLFYTKISARRRRLLSYIYIYFDVKLISIFLNIKKYTFFI